MISHAFVFEVLCLSLWLSHIQSFTRHRKEDHRIHPGEGRDLRLSIPLETLLIKKFQIDFRNFISTFGWFHAKNF
jgi:hypothetical protein